VEIISDTEKCNSKKRTKSKDERERNKELTTKRWSKFRQRIIDRDGGHCQRCLIKYNIINSDKLQVYHLKPRIKYPELMYEQTNCLTLCATCNQQLGTAEQLDFDCELSELEYEFHL
jgi:5-methylcytosine-specific restriction endonuclease McrA